MKYPDDLLFFDLEDECIASQEQECRLCGSWFPADEVRPLPPDPDMVPLCLACYWELYRELGAQS